MKLLKHLATPDQFELTLLHSIRLARKEYQHYRRRNSLGVNGELPSDFSENDWVRFYTTKSRLVTLQDTLRAYRTFRLYNKKAPPSTIT